MKNLLQKKPLFLFLLPLFIVLHIEKEYHQFINYRLVYKEIIILFVIPLIVYAICFLLTRSYRKAGVLSFILLFVFYFFGELKDRLKEEWPGSFWQSYTFLLPVILIITMFFLFLAWRKKTGFKRFNLFINIALLLFIIADFIGLLYERNAKKQNINSGIFQSFVPCPDCEKPDIYYLVFDSYTSSELLKREFNFNNAAIDTWLEGKGFKIIRYSRSNYNRTPFSIESTFNMDYLPSSYVTRQYFLKNYLAGITIVYNNQLLPLFAQSGYAIYNHSIFEFKSYPSSIPSYDTWDINALYERHNIFKKIDMDIGWQFPSWLRLSGEKRFKKEAKERDQHDSIAISEILRTAQTNSSRPKFVYGHIFLPHHPYTFDSAGTRHDPPSFLTPQQEKQAYLQQVVYSNKIIRQLVDTILTYRKRPAVIIIQGDHGFRRFDGDKIYLEFPNFNAIYFSNQDYHLLNDSLTNVNTFRVVFNTFFRQRFPLVDNHINFLQNK